ncbi:hypothetical protein DIU31_028480 [Mucilaginibacter rubeus]|uniref:Uncharacterized protein n=1 Tax=Mucilaginibacter rubeus TaxID=2027860 RepID=A0AAE6JM39_9SPHI|nr:MULTISPECIES: hypothetical protein [Mucilaginibacter]QEM07245.1 hypothetical protein DIU31_028480 [Mucilaginibacter rubeus]QEM19701.1 hypothetical protein DIU38_028055 [Mucilaginibacter gossypii]QTE43602.1 hypothetical protein J3L19_32570 [Mucilaginibacter rubeus]QTE50202.1 hypothetical protein J3L21_32525 [Mucilaginibacter rubeus]QTE55290.1 hypothetical protein J3L23_24145 [Mucilaginibacter rubeus]
MCEALNALGVPLEVQRLFNLRDAVFDYGDSVETYTPASFFIPASRNLWIAGNESATEVLISRSAMDCIAFLSLNLVKYRQPEKLCFIGLGNRPANGQLNWIRDNFKKRKYTLLFEDDLAGRATDIVVAAGLKSHPIRLQWLGETVVVACKNRSVKFPVDQLSLNTFELAFSIRTGIRTRKPIHYSTFLDQLRYDTS